MITFVGIIPVSNNNAYIIILTGVTPVMFSIIASSSSGTIAMIVAQHDTS